MGKTFGDTITGESEKVIIVNYTYVEANPDLLTIGTDATKNVITLYYTKDAPTPGTFNFNDVFHVWQEHSRHHQDGEGQCRQETSRGDL